MSAEYIILLVDEPESETNSIDGQAAKVFMRFYEPPTPEYLKTVARENPGKRVYSLLGASTWYSLQ